MTLPQNVQQTLIARFQQDMVRQDVYREGENFRPRYIDPIGLITRLNESFGFAWSDQIISVWHSPDNRQVMVHVRLSCRDEHGREVFHDAVGQADLKINPVPSQNGQATLRDYGYDLKAAHTDAIRKAATKFGIGLQVYSKDEAPFQGLTRIEQTVNTAIAPQYQVQQAVQLLEGQCGVPRQAWMGALGISSPDQMTVEQAVAILSRRHPLTQHLGAHANGGLRMQDA